MSDDAPCDPPAEPSSASSTPGTPPGPPPPPHPWRPAATGPVLAAGYGAGFGPRPWAPPARLGPVTTLPRTPGPLADSIESFWRAGRSLSAVTLAVCAAVGVLGGMVLVGHRAGFGAALVAAAVWAASVPALVRRRAVSDLVTAALSVALVAMVAVRDAGWIVGLCVTAGAGLAAVAATGARSAPAVLGSVGSWCAGLVRAVPWVGRSVRAGVPRGRLVPMVRTAAVTVLLLGAFGLLFSSADLVFASYLPDMHLETLPAQVVVALGVGLTAVTLVHLAAAPPAWSNLRAAPGRPAPLVEWATPVVALAVLVLAFVLVQVGGLLGGHRRILEAADLSYAEYARQGFGQLVAATALTLVVVGVAARHAPRATARERLLVRAALGVLCVGTLGVVASALRRMDLYVEAFGLTRLRLFVFVAEGVLGVVLLLVLAAGVRWRGTWLPRAIAQVAGLALLALALANPDAVILRHNTTVLAQVALDSEVAGRSDLDYLQGLSADAVPVAAALDEPLRSCILRAIEVAEVEGPVDWNLGRAQAADALDGRGIDPGVDCGLSSDDR